MTTCVDCVDSENKRTKETWASLFIPALKFIQINNEGSKLTKLRYGRGGDYIIYVVSTLHETFDNLSCPVVSGLDLWAEIKDAGLFLVCCESALLTLDRV